LAYLEQERAGKAPLTRLRTQTLKKVTSLYKVNDNEWAHIRLGHVSEVRINISNNWILLITGFSHYIGEVLLSPRTS